MIKLRTIFNRKKSITIQIPFYLLFLVMGVSMLTFGSSLLINNVFADQKVNPLANSASVKEAIIFQEAMRQIYKEVNPAVVRIEIEDTTPEAVAPFGNDPMFRFFFGQPQEQQQQPKEKKATSVGSGFILTDDGYIVTNHHVVARPNSKQYVDKVFVKLSNGKDYPAKIIGSDASSDIALLKIEQKNLKSVYIGNSDDVEVGDFAIAIGNPFGLASTFTKGVISSKGQSIDTDDNIPRIQTDAPINPGNSGGPLLNIKGEVIGINQMIYTRSGGSLGIGFAIPMNYAMSIIQKLKSGTTIKHGFIGINILPTISKEQAKELEIENIDGLLIANVIIGSPAWKAGLRPYDFIIKLDDKEVSKFSELKSLVINKGVDGIIKVTYLRNQKEVLTSVKIGDADLFQKSSNFQEENNNSNGGN